MSAPPSILREGNYTTWAAQTRTQLIKAGVWHHASTTISPPSAPGTSATAAERQEYRLHHEAEGKALGTILEHLSPSNARLVAEKTANLLN